MSAVPRPAAATTPAPEAGRIPAAAWQRALEHCTALTARSGSNFYLAFLPLPRPRREGIFCVYAFCRHVDDLVDIPQPGVDVRAELAAWRRRIGEIAAGTLREDEHPVAVALAVVCRRYPVRAEDLLALVDGVEMDLEPRRYATRGDLDLYCERVAGRVGCACLPVFGATSDQARRYALTLGRAFQLTNILRDVGRDAAQGRIYLPLEDLARFGVTESDLVQGRRTAGVLGLLRQQGERALLLLQEAEDLLPPDERRHLYPAAIMAAIYRRLLLELGARDHDSWGDRVRLPRALKASLALGVFLRDRVLHSW
jgi:phytoene synthase